MSCTICGYEFKSWPDHRLCFILRYTSINTAAQPSVLAGGSSGRNEDPKTLAASIKSRNFMRYVWEANPREEALAIEEWARFKGVDAVLPSMPPMPPPPPKGVKEMPLTMLQQLETHVTPIGIVGHPTPLKQLCDELHATPQRSLLTVLYTNHYTSEHAIMMGAEFGLITACGDDWDVILNKKFFTPYQLCHMGFTFTRMLLAGMDLDLFSYAGMDHEALHIIRFSIRAFRCAKGTKEQLDRILGGSPTTSPYTF
jgi:hypothetical protein